MAKDDIIRDILRLRGNILRNFNKIKKYKESHPVVYAYAQEEYELNVRAIKSTAKGLKTMETRELQSILRELSYIRGLKTSTLSSVKKVNKPGGFIDVLTKLESTAKELKKSESETKRLMYKAYKMAYHENPSLERFVYTALDTILNTMVETNWTPVDKRTGIAGRRLIENQDLLDIALDVKEYMTQSDSTHELVDETDSFDIRNMVRRFKKRGTK